MCFLYPVTVHIFTLSFFKIRFNIILLYTSTYRKWPPFFRQFQFTSSHSRSFKICFSIILLCTSIHQKWCPFLRFPYLHFAYISRLNHACYTSSLCHLSWFKQPNNNRWEVKIMKIVVKSPSSLRFLVLKHSQSRYFFRVKKQVSNSYTTGKIIMCMF
jgi:hypothetical protein